MADDYDVKLLVKEGANGRTLEGLPALVARVRRIPGASSDWAKQTAEAGVRVGAKVMTSQAPSSKEDHSNFPVRSPAAAALMDAPEHTKLKDRISFEKEATWAPGGAGGGGAWSASFGVKRDKNFSVRNDPASLVFHGTGRRGDHLASGSHISSPRGNVMTWMEGGHQVFARTTGGQVPQKKWVRMAQDATKGEIARRIAVFNLSGRRP